MKQFLQIFFLLSIFYSCEEPEREDEPVQLDYHSVFVLNEGNFGYGNASIDLFQPSNAGVDSRIFYRVNGRPIGDVLESMQIIKNKAYLVVNNSSKVEIVELPSFKSVGSISNLPSPRVLLQVNASKAYLSDFLANEIHVVDLSKNAKIGGIPTTGWIEGMALSEEKVFACQATGNEVWVLDTSADSVRSKIKVGVEPLTIVKDKTGFIWVLCTGGFVEDFPSLHKIDPHTEQVVLTLVFPNKSDYPDNLQIDAAGEKLYFLNNGLYQMSITDDQLPLNALIPSNERLLYGLGLDPHTGHIYLSDAIDYQQKGTVYQYDSNGNLLHTFKAGIIPGAFGFYFDE